MNDKRDKPVSMRKTPAGTTPAGTLSGVQRPGSIRALAAAMLLSGLAAVIAAIALYGQHDYLVRSLSKSQPDQKISTSTISSVSAGAGTALMSDLTGLVGQQLSDKQISTESDAVGATLKSGLPTKNATDDQVKDQVDATKSAVSSQLNKLSGQLTTAQVSARAKALTTTVKDNLTTLQKNQLSPSQINDKANKAPSQILIQNLLLFAALGFVGFGAYAGRHWSRWAIPIIWVLASFTGTAAGFTSVVQAGSDLPAGYKAAATVSAIALIVAVLLSFLRPSKDWFAAHRPAQPADGPRRRGMFTPRLPPPAQARSAGRFGPKDPTATSASAKIDNTAAAKADQPAAGGKAGNGASAAKSKKRVAAAATSNGAAVARARAKTASKSRRTTES